MNDFAGSLLDELKLIEARTITGGEVCRFTAVRIPTAACGHADTPFNGMPGFQGSLANEPALPLSSGFIRDEESVAAIGRQRMPKPFADTTG